VTELTPLQNLWLTETVRLREEHAGPWMIWKPTDWPAARAAICRHVFNAAPYGWPNAMG